MALRASSTGCCDSRWLNHWNMDEEIMSFHLVRILNCLRILFQLSIGKYVRLIEKELCKRLLLYLYICIENSSRSHRHANFVACVTTRTKEECILSQVREEQVSTVFVRVHLSPTTKLIIGSVTSLWPLMSVCRSVCWFVCHNFP